MIQPAGCYPPAPSPLFSVQWKRQVTAALWARVTPEKKNNGITGRISCSGSWQVVPSFSSRQCVNQRDSLLWGLGHCKPMLPQMFPSLRAIHMTSFCVTFNEQPLTFEEICFGKKLFLLDISVLTGKQEIL